MLRAFRFGTLAGLVLCGIFAAAEVRGAWLDVPFVKQPKNGCGAAALSMVMQYWAAQQHRPPEKSAELDRIQDAAYSREARGILASEMQRYLLQHGFQAFAFPGTWNDLQQHLEKGRPLIVALQPSGRGLPLHYVVVAGIEPGQDRVLLNDPAQRKLLAQDRASFEKQWKGARNWTLLAVPRLSAD